LVTASPELRSFVEAHGGSLYVRTQYHRGCRGVALLWASVRAPASVAAYELFVVDGIFVHTRLPVRSRPAELALTMQGRRHRRPVASWDGCAFVL
jgi:hypothetical protein